MQDRIVTDKPGLIKTLSWRRSCQLVAISWLCSQAISCHLHVTRLFCYFRNRRWLKMLESVAFARQWTESLNEASFCTLTNFFLFISDGNRIFEYPWGFVKLALCRQDAHRSEKIASDILKLLENIDTQLFFRTAVNNIIIINRSLSVSYHRHQILFANKRVKKVKMALNR